MKVAFVSRRIIVFTLNLCALAAPVVSQADILYATDGDQIEKFDSLGVSTVITSANSGSFIADGLAFDKAGNLYAADQSIPAILKFNSSGVSTVFGSAGGIGPQGIAFDSAGNLYEALNGNNAIEKFDLSGNRTVFAAGTALGVGLNFPVDLAIDSSNNLFVSGQLNTIVKINPSGVVTTFATTSTGVSFPLGLAFDSAGTFTQPIQETEPLRNSTLRVSVRSSPTYSHRRVGQTVWPSIAPATCLCPLLVPGSRSSIPRV